MAAWTALAALLAALSCLLITGAAAPVRYEPPVPGDVTRLFERPAERWSAGHRGVDLAADPGATVHSPAAGVVTFAGQVAGRGVVTVRHADGLRSSLEPVEPSVATGDEVDGGAVLGTLQTRSGHQGVHWGVRRGTRYLDPLRLLARTTTVVLLPLDRG